MWVIFVIASLLISSDVWALVEIPPCVAMVKPLDSSNYVGSTQDFKHGFSTLYRDRYTDTSSNYFEGIGGHPGVDIFQDSQGEHLTTSTPVQAICAGIVERVTENGKKDGGWGNSLTIRHNVPGIGTVFSIYAHLDRFTRKFAKDDPITHPD